MQTHDEDRGTKALEPESQADFVTETLVEAYWPEAIVQLPERARELLANTHHMDNTDFPAAKYQNDL
jgi:hypothetical protein